MILRSGADTDAAAFITLISACWAEYPGCIMDVDGENPELRRLASTFAEASGALWVADGDGDLLGMIGTKPGQDGWEICKVYVEAGSRGTGLADRLIEAAEAHARAAGALSLYLWSDTRFNRAHRFYERHGYVREGGIRVLDDISNTLEYRYAKPSAGLAIRQLDTAAAASAAAALGRILADCVNAGASISFLPPMDRNAGRDFYRTRATQIARGGRVLLAAWLDGTLAGSVMLDLDMPQNQQHRADVQKLLVSPAMRRRGVAQALMQRVQDEAVVAGRSLLVLDTRAGDASEHLYRTTGWTEAGRIPGFAQNPDGSLADTVLFYCNPTTR